MSFYLALLLYLIGIIGYLFNNNLIMIIISLEILFLSLTLAFINISFIFNDLVGSTFSLILLPLAGAESAISLAYLVCFYPLKLHLSY